MEEGIYSGYRKTERHEGSVSLAGYREKMAEYIADLSLIRQERARRLSVVDARRRVWDAIFLELLEANKAAHAAGRCSPNLRPAHIVEEILRRDAKALRAAGYEVTIGGGVVLVRLLPVAGRCDVHPYRSAPLSEGAPYLGNTTGRLGEIFSEAEKAFFAQFIAGRHP